MNRIVLDGRNYAKICEDNLIKTVSKLKNKPKLAVILVGNDPSSLTYVNMKANKCKMVGIENEIYHLEEKTSTEEVISLVNKLNNEKKINGIIIQHPMPKHIDENLCFNSISPLKDVDGLNALTFGNMSVGNTLFYSATPLAIISLLKYYNISFTGKNVVVIGRSRILGKPLAMMLLNENATVTICHSYTKNIEIICKKADIVVGAIGKAHCVKPSWIKKGVILVDAGYNKNNKGDIDPECFKKSIAYTPVPGGVGPVTIIKLLEQVVTAKIND